MEIRPSRWGLALAVASTACSLNSGGLGGGGTDAVADDSTGVVTSADTSTGPVLPPMEMTTAADSTTTTTTTTSSMTTSSETESTGPAPVTAHSCDELFDQDEDTPTGVHTLVDADEVEYEAFCLMDFDDGGGWTLVGRTSSGASLSPFGWRSERGAVDDYGDAYSLDAWGKGLEFSEVLLADRTGDESVPFERAYSIAVPPDFLEAYEDSAFATDGVTRELGDCDPPGGPDMMSHLGYTGETDQFFVRDLAGNDDFGLRAHEWGLAYDDCDRGGEMDDAQGVIFVR